MTVLFVFFIALSFSTSTAFAADTITNTSSASSSQVTNQSTTTKTNLAAGSPTTVSFTSSQINAASTKVKTFVETNNRLPSYVTISNTQVTMPQFLKLITQNLININSGTSKTISLTTVNSVSTNQTETVKTGNIYKSEYITLAKSINTYINTNGVPQKTLNVSLGKINFSNTVYTFSKILNYYVTNKRLPNYVSVKAMTPNTSTNPPEGVLRPVYIISDVINGYSIDNARINSLVAGLKKLGVTAVNYGTPGKLWKLLADSSVPSNALIVEIAGGADAGSIKEKGSAWYQNLLKNKKDFIVFTDCAKDITGLAWLERAHDDNYSPASFKGLAHPDQYLLNHGVGYFEPLTNSNISACIQALYKAALS
ncbi:MAG TPA: pseudomurein-binding repeat-containing protein [Methanobacterium sp.]|nr:pseudomurein-binding repeat-containing protein [Methanobacterium sp.]